MQPSPEGNVIVSSERVGGLILPGTECLRSMQLAYRIKPFKNYKDYKVLPLIREVLATRSVYLYGKMVHSTTLFQENKILCT